MLRIHKFGHKTHPETVFKVLVLVVVLRPINLLLYEYWVIKTDHLKTNVFITLN